MAQNTYLDVHLKRKHYHLEMELIVGMCALRKFTAICRQLIEVEYDNATSLNKVDMKQRNMWKKATHQMCLEVSLCRMKNKKNPHTCCLRGCAI